MFRQQDTLDMHVYNKNTSQNIYVCLDSKIPQICMYIAKIPHNIYIYAQVTRYLGYASIQQKYHTKIYICLGSKVPHEKKKNKNKQKKEINK